MNQSHDRISDVWGSRTSYFEEWPSRVDSHLLGQPERWIQSVCGFCSVGCALDIGLQGDRIIGVRGRASDISNRGRLGPKGLYGWQANSSSDRLRTPFVKRRGKLVPATWDEAFSLIIERVKETRSKYSSNSLAFYNTGQILLEEYYTLAVIAKAGLGTPHVDGNTRLCTATAAVALMESFGTDGQPGCYRDIDLTDALFLVGHNMAEQQTVLWMRILDRVSGPKRPKIIVVDPRRTATAKLADLHLAPPAIYECSSLKWSTKATH